MANKAVFNNAMIKNLSPRGRAVYEAAMEKAMSSDSDTGCSSGWHKRWLRRLAILGLIVGVIFGVIVAVNGVMVLQAESVAYAKENASFKLGELVKVKLSGSKALVSKFHKDQTRDGYYKYTVQVYQGGLENTGPKDTLDKIGGMFFDNFKEIELYGFELEPWEETGRGSSS
jgi:hypothetical protein